MNEFTRFSVQYLDMFREEPDAPLPVIHCPECVSVDIYNLSVTTAYTPPVDLTFVILVMVCKECNECFGVMVPWQGQTTASELLTMMNAL